MINQSTKQEVKRVLTMYPESRDNDGVLLAHIYQKACMNLGLNYTTLSFKQGMQLVVDNKLPNYKTIERYRRQLQRLDDSLKGARYDERHDKAEMARKHFAR